MSGQRPPYLFNEFDARDVQQDRRERLQRDIAAYDGAKLLNSNLDDLVSYFVEPYRVDVPTLREDEKSGDHQEARRDVSGDPRRMGPK